MSIANSTYSVKLNGTWATDILVVNSSQAKIFTNSSEEHYKFFLINDIELGEAQKPAAAIMGDGFIGLTPNLGSNQETYG